MASETIAQLQSKLQLASAEFQKIQGDLANTVEIRQRLDAQQSENEIVKKEFSTLASSNVVYKLVGPVLVPQDQTEAKNNVEKRLEFIRGDIKRVEGQIKDGESKLEKKRLELIEIQTKLQEGMNQAGGTPGNAITA